MAKVDWSAVLGFAYQHAATGVVSANAMQAAGGFPPFSREWWAAFAVGAVAGGSNHMRQTATVTKEPPPEPPSAPVVVVPLAPAPAVPTEAELRTRIRAIYKDEMGRYPDSEQEYAEALVLLEAHREDELRRNLKDRST